MTKKKRKKQNDALNADESVCADPEKPELIFGGKSFIPCFDFIFQRYTLNLLFMCCCDLLLIFPSNGSKILIYTVPTSILCMFHVEVHDLAIVVVCMSIVIQALTMATSSSLLNGGSISYVRFG